MSSHQRPRQIAKTAAWRQQIADLGVKADSLARALEDRSHNDIDGTPAADIVRRMKHLLDSREATVAQEERLAFDQYAAGYASWGAAPDVAAAKATELLELRRTAFQSPPPEPRTP